MDFGSFKQKSVATEPANNNTADMLPFVPIHLLEAFIPGFSILSRVLVSFGIDVDTLVSTTFIFLAVFGAFQYLWRKVWSRIIPWCTCTVTVTSNDKLFEQILLWVADQDIATSSRRLKASTDQRGDDQRGGGPGRRQRSPSNFYFAEMEASTPPSFTPAVGNHYFWFGRNLLLLEREKESPIMDLYGNNPLTDKESLYIRCFGWSTVPIRDFLVDCKRHDAQQNKSMTTIRRSNVGPRENWAYSSRRPSRSLETVFMNETVKTGLLQDMREFLDPATPVFYARRGIPYRRGYLFYGPPGTGKTSLSFALAGTFGLELYTVSLREPFMSEHKLVQLFASLPSRCIVLLEDVDTAGLEKRENTTGSGKGRGRRKGQAEDEENKPRIREHTQQVGNSTISTPAVEGITLSGLLNAIDGVASQEGRVLIMTSNDPESLDRALIRPGRVDRQVYFSNASKHQARQVFISMYSADKPSSAEDNSEASRRKVDEMTVPENKRLEDMASEFAEAIPSSELTPAELQGFLLLRRESPEKALEDVNDWCKTLLAAREAGTNVVDDDTADASTEGEKPSLGGLKEN